MAFYIHGNDKKVKCEMWLNSNCRHVIYYLSGGIIYTGLCFTKLEI